MTVRIFTGISPYLSKLCEELWRESALGAELVLRQRHVLLGLGVEGGVHNETVDKNPHVVPDLMGLDRDAA